MKTQEYRLNLPKLSRFFTPDNGDSAIYHNVLGGYKRKDTLCKILEFQFSSSINWRNSCCITIHYLVIIVNYLHCLKLWYCGYTHSFSWQFYLLFSDSLEQIILDCTWRHLNLFINKRKNSNKQDFCTKTIKDNNKNPYGARNPKEDVFFTVYN